MGQTRQSEHELEQQLISYLSDTFGYQYIFLKGLEAMEANLRHCLQELNWENLEQTPFSEKEFERIRVYLRGNSVFDSAKILRDKFLLLRDDDSQVYLDLIDLLNCQAKCASSCRKA